MKIGVSTRIVAAQGYSEDRDALAQVWGSFLATALPDALWLPIPNLGADRTVQYCADWGLDRLILSGGDDIGNTPLRDVTEKGLLDWAEAYAIPVLGICRGMQMMAHWAGVGLRPVEGHVQTRHPLSGEVTGKVNSYHVFSLIGCPRGFEVLARSVDGEIEAIRHLSLPWEGWMWHPEREAAFAAHDIQRLKALFA